jgi:hypothetical protein
MKIILSLSLFSILVVACMPATPTVTSVPEPTNTPSPTELPSPTPTQGIPSLPNTKATPFPPDWANGLSYLGLVFPSEGINTYLRRNEEWSDVGIVWDQGEIVPVYSPMLVCEEETCPSNLMCPIDTNRILYVDCHNLTVYGGIIFNEVGE